MPVAVAVAVVANLGARGSPNVLVVGVLDKRLGGEPILYQSGGDFGPARESPSLLINFH